MLMGVNKLFSAKYWEKMGINNSRRDFSNVCALEKLYIDQSFIKQIPFSD